MVGNIEIISKELIIPSSPTPLHHKDHKLSFLDQLLPTTFFPLIFFYQNESCSIIDHAKTSQHLKQSLSEVLTIFYPFAGRINGNDVDCNDSGVVFVEAQLHVPLSQAMQNLTTEELNQFLPLKPFTNGNDLPLAVQISFFECGSTAIGVCASHRIADAMSLVTFMNAWAATSRGEALIVQPSFELARHLFPPVNNTTIPSNFTAEFKENFVTKKFLFNKEKLEALKEFGSGSHVKDPTRVEAVSAFIWKHVIGVTQAKVDDPKRIMFAATHAVNLRSRMSLPFDSFAFGNVSVVTSALLKTEEDKEYHDLVWQLRTAIRKINGDYIKNVQSGVNPYLDNTNDEAAQRDMGFCYFTSWCRFPVYEVDYGWGKPISVCSAAAPWKNLVILMSTRYDDGIEAWISMMEDEIAMLPDELLSLETTCI